MSVKLKKTDRFGLVHPAIDAHTLGVSSLAQILGDCGFITVIADAAVCAAFGAPLAPANSQTIADWIGEHGITVLGFSYRLDPHEGAETFGQLVHLLKARGLLQGRGGPIRALYFAGLPAACAVVKAQHPEVAGVFAGDETPGELLTALGVDPNLLPSELAKGVSYDDDRLAFGRHLIQKGDYLAVAPVDRRGYTEFGTSADTLLARLRHGGARQLPPLMRAHVGPYGPNRQQAVSEFLQWVRQLAQTGFLDILSIGTSQLTQSDFGLEWGDRPNGGGVPINSAAEFAAVRAAAYPMLVRTYAGTRNIPQLACMHEQTLNIAWHALSLWWFCQSDGRGPYSVRENLQQHVETLRYIASTGKPFEPNVSHHFAFRGADDVTYVVAGVLAAKLAKSLGIRHLVLQNMLNTPKQTWGIQDLAKSRAMLHLARELEDERFRVILQPRGGLDYFSPESQKAKAQLAAVTALMDDIEPQNSANPPIIHVVSYSEASHLADPAVINESIQITRHALDEYRKLRARGQIDDMARNADVLARTVELLGQARAVIQNIETHIAQPYTVEGLYQVFADGFLPIPYLWECKEEFKRAIGWQTRLIHGSVKVVDPHGIPIPISKRLRQTEESAAHPLVAG